MALLKYFDEYFKYSSMTKKEAIDLLTIYHNKYPNLSMVYYLWVDPDIQCPKCKDTFFYKGCPSCGNTFINREILRQTS